MSGSGLGVVLRVRGFWIANVDRDPDVDRDGFEGRGRCRPCRWASGIFWVALPPCV